MLARGLIDAGALLALLDRDDRWHGACVAAFERARLPLATTAAALAELFHLLGPGARERRADRPMDFADATLVLVARKLQLNEILTVDHDDFETYRVDGKRSFRVLPARAPSRRG